MDISGDFPNGIKFYGTKGWLFVTRTEQTSPNGLQQGDRWHDRRAGNRAGRERSAHPAIGHRPDEMHLYKSTDQHGNWLDCIRSRQAPISPIETGHRACSTCLIHQMAMHSKRHLHWNPQAEHFLHDDKADAMLSRPQRSKYAYMS